jgi:hypothetical protein
MPNPRLRAIEATAQTSMSEAKESGSISIERCSSGRDHEQAAQIMYRVVPPGVVTFDSVEPGSATIRLWYPSGLTPTLFVSGAATDKPREFLGRRREKVVETLSFSGSAEATLSKGFAASGITVVAETAFINKDGGGVGTPVYHDGAFRVTDPAYGAIVVEYEAAYDAHRIYYGLPDWVIRRAFIDPMGQSRATNGEGLAHLTVPPVFVAAFAKGHMATALIERRIMNVTPPDCKDDDWLTDMFESTYCKYRFYPDYAMTTTTPRTVKEPGIYQESKAYIKHVQYCRNKPNRKKIQTYPEPKGDNIVVYPGYIQGSI